MITEGPNQWRSKGVHLPYKIVKKLSQFNVFNAQACRKSTLGKVASGGVRWRPPKLEKNWCFRPVMVSERCTGLNWRLPKPFRHFWSERHGTPCYATFPSVVFMHAWALKTLNWRNCFSIPLVTWTPMERHCFRPSLMTGSGLATLTP